MLFREAGGPPACGLFALNMYPAVTPVSLAGIAVLAEDLGYESIWVGEHPVLPDPPGPDSPFDPRLHLIDPVVMLSFLAAATERIRLATGILLLPLRNPVVLAKQLASLDVLSGGRTTLGFGVGYIQPEAAAVGIPYKDRAHRAREHLEAMRSLWHDDKPAYHGRYVDFAGVDAHPRPVQADFNVVAGGHSPLALRRAVTHAHGWYGFGLTPQAVAVMKRGLEHEAERHERPEHLGPLEITVTPPRTALTPGMVAQYQKLGVDRLVLFPPDGLGADALKQYVRDNSVFA